MIMLSQLNYYLNQIGYAYLHWKHHKTEVNKLLKYNIKLFIFQVKFKQF